MALYDAMNERHRPPAPGVLPNTPHAIKRFQRFHGLVPDGIVGPKTRHELRRLRTRLVNPPSNHRIFHSQYTPGPNGQRIINN